MQTLVMDAFLGKELDGYRIDKVLGHGGLARVYRGLDVRMRRYTAIKVLVAPVRDPRLSEQRFEIEARAIARLKHPNIVTIYRFNKIDGVYYIAMEYVSGADLHWVLGDYRNRGALMDYQAALKIMEQIADALDYAHSKGVIHRDIKPSNIMINRQGEAILTDFNLARIVTEDSAGEAFGTPHYISPEQISSSTDVVPQSDFYSLGVILYEVLVGEVPFQGDSVAAIAHGHLRDPIPDPLALNPDLHPAFVPVLQKALAKTPQGRYPSGKAFVEAVRAAVEGSEQTGVRSQRISHISPVERITQRVTPLSEPFLTPRRIPRLIRPVSIFVRHYPLAAVVILALASVLVWLNIIAPSQGSSTAQPEAAISEVRFQGGKEMRVSAGQELVAANVDVRQIAWSPDGHYAAGAGADGRIIVWDAADKQIVYHWPGHTGAVNILAWQPGGSQFLVSGGADHRLLVWDVERSSEPIQTLDGHSTEITSVAWSPDGSQLISGDRSGRIIRWQAGDEWQEVGRRSTTEVHALDWSSDGLRFVSGGDSVRVWDTASDTSNVLGVHGAPIRAIDWGSITPQIVAVSDDGDVRLWRVERNDYIRLAWGLEGAVDARFSPNESLIAAAYGTEVRVWETTTFQLVAILDIGNNQSIRSIDWSPDGVQLMAVTETGSAKIWTIPTTIPERLTVNQTLAGHAGSVNQMAWDASGGRMATFGSDNIVTVWDTINKEQLFELSDISTANLASLAWRADPAAIAVGDCNGMISLVDAASQRVTQQLTGHQGCVSGLAFGPDGQLLWSADSTGTLRIWNLDTFEVLLERQNLQPDAITDLIVPDGTHFATIGAEGSLRLWGYEAGQLQPITTQTAANTMYADIAWNPRNNTLLSSDGAGRIRRWSDPFGSIAGVEFVQDQAGIKSLAVNQTGEYLAAIDEDQCLTLWAIQTAERLFQNCDAFAQGHTVLAWSPGDAVVLVTGTEQGEIVFWQVP